MAALEVASHMLWPKPKRVSNRQCIRSKLRLVVAVPLHVPLDAKSPPATQLEQSIVTFRLEAPLLEQYADEGDLIGGWPEPRCDFVIGQPRCRALALDFRVV